MCATYNEHRGRVKYSSQRWRHPVDVLPCGPAEDENAGRPDDGCKDTREQPVLLNTNAAGDCIGLVDEPEEKNIYHSGYGARYNDAEECYAHTANRKVVDLHVDNGEGLEV